MGTCSEVAKAPRGPLLWALHLGLLLLGSAGCTADLLPVSVGGATLRLEAAGLPGITAVAAEVPSDGPKVVVAGGNEVSTLLLTRVSGVWTETVVPSGWSGPIRGLGQLPSGELLLVGDGLLARGGLGRFGPATSPGEQRLTAASGDGHSGFFVAAEGAALRLEGEALVELPLVDTGTAPLDSALLAVRAETSSSADFVGDGGLVLHYDGQNLKRQSSGTRVPLRALAGKLGQPLYAVGGSTTAVTLRREFGRWSRVQHPVFPPLHGAAVDDDGQLWVVGEGGTFARFDGVEWSVIRTNYPDEIFRAVTASNDGVFLVGGGVILRYAP
ncbi:MAG: hypothetical protein IPG45_35325 [Deltaproteobacteria bacterium]|jgi:hypothetical protein|nr:hypothetical protein [Deltaproteobacteria bacterium]